MLTYSMSEAAIVWRFERYLEIWDIWGHWIAYLYGEMQEGVWNV